MNSRKIAFVKMHGLGNDYIFVDVTRSPIVNPSQLSRLWSDRHFGIGSDGLVLFGKSADDAVDFTMRIFNADGSEGRMCGNAVRCIGKYVYESGLTSKRCVRLATLSGVKELLLDVDASGSVRSVKVDMGEPRLSDASLFVPAACQPLPDGVFVSMGNPHYVVFVRDLASVDVAAEGARLEQHPCFPERCNVEFAQVLSSGVRMRVWERGSGITLACGTGACAVAVAAASTGRSSRMVDVHMDGGGLRVEWDAATNHVFLIGSAQIVYQGEIALPD